MCFSVSCPISWLSYLYQPSSFGLGLIQIHRAMISGMIQKNTCNKVYMYTILIPLWSLMLLYLLQPYVQIDPYRIVQMMFRCDFAPFTLYLIGWAYMGLFEFCMCMKVN